MSTDIEIDTVEDLDHSATTYDAATEQGDSILVEGVTELESHPQIFAFVKGLNELKNRWVRELEDFSKDSELQGSVRIFFSVRDKESKPKSLENLTLEL